LQQKGVIYKKQEQEPDKYNFSSSLMQDLVRQKFDQSTSEPEKREIVFESNKFRTKITKKEVNMGKKMSSLLLKVLKALSEINHFNKSE
jgi:hypothetical protein